MVTDILQKMEVTHHLMLQARAEMSEKQGKRARRLDCNKMIKQLLQQKKYERKRSSSSSNIVKLIFLRKLDAPPKKSFIALTSVMSKRCATCVSLRLERDKEPQG